ncbi:MAG: glutamine-hydrolyzing GMP synthase, partial [Bdellovibrionales bacterium]|nr:glutamine-hydrolyzing GMP synthase [Bdellovibrionales bacterium]
MNIDLLILDFGSQFTQLIARRYREMGFYAKIYPFDLSIDEIKSMNPKGIVLSGGPFSVFGDEAPKRDVKELLDIAPLMGVCYGMQLIAYSLGGEVKSSSQREYGLNTIQWERRVFDLPEKQDVWMSHGDVVLSPPRDFEVIAFSSSKHPAVMESDRVLCMQFHPEVVHTEYGDKLLKEFASNFCELSPQWNAQLMHEEVKRSIKESVPAEAHVLCALSGGVDSTVVGAALTEVLGSERVHCVFVDNGLLRHNEFQEVLDIYKELGLNVLGVDASTLFLSRLEGVEDPEEKRKIIGYTFIDVFKEQIVKIESQIKKPIQWLAQGTLYPDVIESVSVYGKSETIKSHHNVGGLPKDLNLNLVEPLKELFKDEVRKLGKDLGIQERFLWRHPFPGPGLGIRIIGPVTFEDLQVLRMADKIFIEELKKENLYNQIWQAFCVLLPVKTVGVQGDKRTYEKVLTLRAVTSKDGMTADWFDFPSTFLRHVSNRITNEVREINRVIYDITSKP